MGPKYFKVHLVAFLRILVDFFPNFDADSNIWFFEKKMCLDFSKVGSKESQWNTEHKVGLRQADILKF
jgi:hypothetical protein